MASALMQPDLASGTGGAEYAGVLSDSLLTSRFGLLIFGADEMAVLQLRNAVLRVVAERNSRVEIVHARPDKDIIADMSRNLGEASLRGDDLHAESHKPIKVLVVSGRIADAVAPMRQLLRIAGTFPGLGLRVLATVDDHPSASPPLEFDTFGAGLQRHHCPTGMGRSFAAADTRRDESDRETWRAPAEPDRSPGINALANGSTGVADGEPEAPPAPALLRPPHGSASAGPAAGRRRVFGLGALVSIVLLALTMAFLMFPRHAQTLKAWLLPVEARLAPAMTKDRINAVGVAEGTDAARQSRATATVPVSETSPATPDQFETAVFGLTPDDHAPMQLIVAEKLGYSKPDTRANAPSAVTRTEPASSAAGSPLDKAISIVRDAPNSAVFIQFVAMESTEDVQKWLAGQAEVKGALVVPIRTREGTPAFAVVQGPFQTRSSAMEFSKRPGVPEVRWLRSAVSLKSALSPPSAPNGVQHGQR